MDNSDKIKCDNCGKPNIAGSKICKYCDQRITTGRPAPQEFKFLSQQAPVYEDIGGWLILFAIAIYFNPLLSFLKIFYTSTSIDTENRVYKLVTIGGLSVDWDPTPVITAELAVAVIMFFFSLSVLRAFYKRSKTLPGQYIIFNLVAVAGAVVELFMLRQSITLDIKDITAVLIPKGANDYQSVSSEIIKLQLQHTQVSVLITVFTAVICIGYFYTSRRVQGTFVK